MCIIHSTVTLEHHGSVKTGTFLEYNLDLIHVFLTNNSSNIVYYKKLKSDDFSKCDIVWFTLSFSPPHLDTLLYSSLLFSSAWCYVAAGVPPLAFSTFLRRSIKEGRECAVLAGCQKQLHPIDCDFYSPRR